MAASVQRQPYVVALVTRGQPHTARARPGAKTLTWQGRKAWARGWRSEAPQGHVTAYLDCPGIPGAAYTALSRVSYGKDIMIGGAVTAAHFQPVDEAKDE